MVGLSVIVVSGTEGLDVVLSGSEDSVSCDEVCDSVMVSVESSVSGSIIRACILDLALVLPVASNVIFKSFGNFASVKLNLKDFLSGCSTLIPFVTVFNAEIFFSIYAPPSFFHFIVADLKNPESYVPLSSIVDVVLPGFQFFNIPVLSSSLPVPIVGAFAMIE